MKTTTILLTVVVAFVLFAGCTGQGTQTSGGDAGTGSSATTGTNGGNANTGGATNGNTGTGTTGGATDNGNAGTGTGTTGGNTGTGGTGGTNGGSDFGSIFANVGSPDYKVTYDYVASGQTMTMTQYMKGGNMRMDSELQGMEMEIFFIDDKVYSCTKMAGTSGFTCFESPSSADDTKPETASNLKESESDYVITPLPGKTIAGEAAKCFTFVAKSGDMESVDYCISGDGIILSLTSAQVTMTAKSVDRGISDDVFRLPATPTSIG